jgi:hypothetical protein
MITFTIDETKHTLIDGAPLRITLVLWSVSKTLDSITGTIVKRGTIIAEDYVPADEAYDTIDEVELVAWLEDLEDTDDIEDQLDIVIAKLSVPEEGSGLPWQESFDQWSVGVAYIIDDVRIYQNIGYECVQSHTAQTTWAPPTTPALWTPYVPPSEGPQPWVQPTGAQDDYDIDDVVTHDNPNDSSNIWVYSSKIASNTTEPGRDGTFDRWWEPVGAAP